MSQQPTADAKAPDNAVRPEALASEASHTPAQPPRWLGKKVGRYKLVSLLGKGAYGRVFLADDTDLHRRVALKVITADATARTVRTGAADVNQTLDTQGAGEAVDQAVERMIREARAAARLEHPNVVQIYDIGRLEGAGLGGFIAMELLDGGTLQDMVDVGGPMDAARACSLIADAAEALQLGHELGVIHRDVKPANLMLSRQGRCKVADFGLAFIDDPGDSHHYAVAAGTALYLPPEVILGHPADARSDQYSLAATLFTLLAGRPPYVGDRKRVLEAHVNAPPPDLRPVRPDIDPRLAEVVKRGMAKDPAQRFPSIRHFGKALRLFTVAIGPGGSTTADEPFSSASFDAANEQALRRVASDAGSSASFSGLGFSAGAEVVEGFPVTPPGSRLAGSARSRNGGSRGRGEKERKPSLLPWLLAGAAALLVLSAMVLWSTGIVGGERRSPQLAAGTGTSSEGDQRPIIPPAAEASTDRASPAAGTGGGTAPATEPAAPVGAAPITQPEPQAQSEGEPASDPNPTQPQRAQEPVKSPVTPAPATADPAPRQDSPQPANRQPPREPQQPARAPAPPEQPPQQAPDAIPATEFQRLVDIAEGRDRAHPDREAVVAGKVSYARPSRTGQVFRVRFEGTDRDEPSFLLVWFPRDGMFDRMEEAFGGEAGSDLEGKTIRVSGEVQIYNGEPQIVISSPEQIEVVEPDRN